MGQLTVKEQYARVAYLGISFMIMFTSFNSLQNIVSKLYDDYNYDNLGQTSIIFIYLTFAVATMFTSYLIKVFGYKLVMGLSAVGYAVFQATGLLIASDLGLSTSAVWIIVIIGAMICGASASAIWVAQGAYTSQVASADRKSQLFGLFWALMMSSQIFGNVLTTYLLGKVNNFVYFLTLTILGFLSAAMFIFLPSVHKSETQQKKEKNVSVKEEARKIWNIIKNPKYKYLNLYFLLPGLSIAFYAGFLYKLVNISLPQYISEDDSDYSRRLSENNGLVFIALGVSQLLMGLFMNRFGDKFCKFKLAVVGTLLVELAGVTSFIAYFVGSYPLCFLCAFLWGSSQTFLQTNTNALIAMIFPDNIEAFSAYRILFAFSVSFLLFLAIALGHLPPYIFLTIILVLQFLAMIISLKLKDLKQEAEGKHQIAKDAKTD